MKSNLICEDGPLTIIENKPKLCIFTEYEEFFKTLTNIDTDDDLIKHECIKDIMKEFGE